MKKQIFLSLCFCSFVFLAFSQEKQETWGEISTNYLKTKPHSEWFNKNFADYTPDRATLKALKKQLKGVSIDIYLGTWCGDSKREVPRLMKLLASMDIPATQIRLINLGDTKSGLYKASPSHLEADKYIHRVPTVVLSKGEKQLGRIVESPVVSLEKDLLSILKGERYSANYKVATQLYSTVMSDKGFKAMRDNLAEYADEFHGKMQSSSDLNTLGYVLIDAKKMEEALLIFKLNTLLFPNIANTHDSLGECLILANKKEEAIEAYKKVLNLRPNDESALKQLNILNGK